MELFRKKRDSPSVRHPALLPLDLVLSPRIGNRLVLHVHHAIEPRTLGFRFRTAKWFPVINQKSRARRASATSGRADSRMLESRNDRAAAVNPAIRVTLNGRGLREHRQQQDQQ
jgi:hypothetical protein